jgi:hypothetical protein
LRELASDMHVSVVIIVRREKRRYTLRYLAVTSGETLETLVLRVQGRRLARATAVQLVAATHRALTALRASRAAAVASRPEPVTEAAAPAPAVTEPREANVNQPSAYESHTEIADAEPEANEPAGAEAVVVQDRVIQTEAGRTFHARLGAGLGFANRSVVLPTRVGQRTLATGLFPALDVSLSGEAVLAKYWLFGAHARYQTSVFLSNAEAAPMVSDHKTSLRAHHLELGITPGLRFSDSDAAVTLHLFFGWNWRGLRSVVDTLIPRYTLQGILLRPELRIPLARGGLVVSLAPELFWINVLTAELRSAGGTSGTGVAFGGEIGLDFRLLARLQLSLNYRESHAVIGTVWSADMTDVERFATVRLVFRYQ